MINTNKWQENITYNLLAAHKNTLPNFTGTHTSTLTKVRQRSETLDLIHNTHAYTQANLSHSFKISHSLCHMPVCHSLSPQYSHTHNDHSFTGHLLMLTLRIFTTIRPSGNNIYFNINYYHIILFCENVKTYLSNLLIVQNRHRIISI